MAINYQGVSDFSPGSLMLKDFKSMAKGENRYSANLVLGFSDNLNTSQVLAILANKCNIDAVGGTDHCVVVGSLIIQKVLQSIAFAILFIFFYLGITVQGGGSRF